MNNYPIVPGRGLNTRTAQQARLEFLHDQGLDLPLIADSRLDQEQIRHNIESWIGSIEIPIGLAGPLLFQEQHGSSFVYAPVGTLEGALVASMNRGAKVVSQSGGFRAEVLHQKMVRSPMFIFAGLADCVQFREWVNGHFKAIREVAEQYSNHAQLLDLNPWIAGRSVHLKFVYSTGDAAGQNMTTTCTAHAMTWIREQFERESGIRPEYVVIEGNAASDKKVSHFSMAHGRGIHVVAECRLQNEVIEKILRVKTDDFLRCLSQSRLMSDLDGMMGYNINVANAIAAIFVATGQDLASIHESGVGILHLEKTDDGLYCSLHLPSLVIGTVGGGTHLPRQQEALRLMGCAGGGKVERLAKVIAGFALSLELSTFAAIVGGQFAKAHEKIGRNRPVDWLVKAEVDQAFLEKSFKCPFREQLRSVRFLEKELVANGLIIQLTSRVNHKLSGFIPLEVELQATDSGLAVKKAVLLKSKPLDVEVFQGLHYMAASIDPQLADLITSHQQVLEFHNCHHKEIALYRALDQRGFCGMPVFYGSYQHSRREIHTLFIELLHERDLHLFNTENQPEQWSPDAIKAVIRTITEVHQLFSLTEQQPLEGIPVFEAWKAQALYRRFAEILNGEYRDTEWRELPQRLLQYNEQLEVLQQTIRVPKTIIHNDCNPRNVAVRADGQVCIYDWELAVYNYPHRDIVEFLSFVLPENFTSTTLLEYLKYHFSLQHTDLAWSEWSAAYSYALKEYLLSRVTFYQTGKILMEYLFADRIFGNAFRMIDQLTQLAA